MKTLTTILRMNELFKTQAHKFRKLILRNFTEEEPKPAKKIRRQIIKTSKEVEKYLCSSDHLLKIKHELPVRFLKRNYKAPDDLYLVDSIIGKEIVAALKPHILNTNKTIIETNPGFGFVTKELLDAGVKNIQLYETVVSFRSHILDLDREYPNRLKMYNRDFFSIWKLSYQDRYDNGDRVKRMLSNIHRKKWDDDLAMTIIGTTASTNFIRHLMLSLIFQFGIMTYGRCELYLILPPCLYLQLIAKPSDSYILYRASSVLFQLLFDHKILLKLPREAFLPWDNVIISKSKRKLWKHFSTDSDYMYLTKIEFKKELCVPVNKLQHLWYFVHHLMLSRSGKLIPLLEKWIPEYGIKLIINNLKLSSEDKTHIYPNLDIYTQCGHLNPDQYLLLFKDFSNSPEYNESAFIASMEEALLKMEAIQNMDDHNEVTEEHEEKKESNNVEN